VQLAHMCHKGGSDLKAGLVLLGAPIYPLVIVSFHWCFVQQPWPSAL
jgi:hypothetical protein